MDILIHYEVINYKAGETDKYTHDEIDDDCTIYYMNRQRHCDNDLPAVIYSDGGKEWWFNGKRHRDNDKPAVICPDGSQEWWFNGHLHRDNYKPAAIYPNGARWWVNGKFIRKN